MLMNKVYKHITRIINHENKYNLILSYALLFIGLLFILQYQSQLIKLTEWGDESETVLVTKMMVSGLRLYTEVYNNHGPLVFLPGFIISLLGNYHVWVYRIPIFLLQWITLLSIFFSPIFTNKALRNYSILIIFTIMNVFLPYIYGHAYLYQVISGYFIVIILFIFTLPSINKTRTNVMVNVLAGFLIACLIFLAITSLPVALILLAISCRKFNWKELFIGLVIGLIFNFAFLLYFGSWDGYIAYHFYLNSTILNSGQGVGDYIKIVFDYYSRNYLNLLTLIIVILSVYKLNHLNKDYLRNFLIIPLMMSLVIRGGVAYSFAGLTYTIVLMGLSAVFFIERDNLSGISFSLNQLPVLVFSVMCILILTLPSNRFDKLWEFKMNSDFSRIARTITTKDEKILALTFNSYEYLLADRLPASAHFIYLPIQAEYNKKPYKEVYSNLANDITTNKPKIILIDGWSTWEKENYDWYIYAEDVMEVIYKDYYKLNELPIYIRYDVNMYDYGLDPYSGKKLY